MPALTGLGLTRYGCNKDAGRRWGERFTFSAETPLRGQRRVKIIKNEIFSEYREYKEWKGGRSGGKGDDGVICILLCKIRDLRSATRNAECGVRNPRNLPVGRRLAARRGSWVVRKRQRTAALQNAIAWHGSLSIRATRPPLLAFARLFMGGGANGIRKSNQPDT